MRRRRKKGGAQGGSCVRESQEATVVHLHIPTKETEPRAANSGCGSSVLLQLPLER